jgi:sulfur-oxidizing protein SoxY
MQTTKRRILKFAAVLLSAGLSPALLREVLASTEDTDKAIQAFTGGKTPETGKITLTTPEIAENGNTVPVTVSVESTMSGDDLVEQIIILAEGNPNPDVITFKFSEASGKAVATTRMRLAKTQNVVAVARMKGGAVFMDKKLVKVTIGGCGG